MPKKFEDMPYDQIDKKIDAYLEGLVYIKRGSSQLKIKWIGNTVASYSEEYVRGLAEPAKKLLRLFLKNSKKKIREKDGLWFALGLVYLADLANNKLLSAKFIAQMASAEYGVYENQLRNRIKTIVECLEKHVRNEHINYNLKKGGDRKALRELLLQLLERCDELIETPCFKE